MIKICFCATISDTLTAFVIKLARYIHENTDWDISFICSNNDEFAASLPEYIHYYPVDMKRGISFDGIKVIRAMEQIFRREKFDLVQYSTPNASLYASVAAKRAKIPVRLYCQWGMVFAGFEGYKRKILKKDEKLVCKNSTWIEPDSKSNLAFARGEGLYPPEKSSVIWNGSACGIDLNKFDINKKSEYRRFIRERYEIPNDAFVYIFVGRVKRDKGINELISAYLSQSEKHPSFLFVLGWYELEEGVDMELYERSRSQKNIIYTGEVPDVEKYLSASDCYILPSYREGFGMSVIEAQAMGVPVIVTDIPGPIDGVKKDVTGLVVPKQNVQALSDAMEKLYTDDDLRERFGKAGYEHVKNNFEQQKLFEYILRDRKRLLNISD